MALRPTARMAPLTPRVVRWLRVFFIAVPTIIAIVACFFIVMGTIEWTLARESLGWPTVAGVVETSKVVSSRHNTKGGHRTSHSAQVEYVYEVNGAPHTGSRVSFRVASEGEADAIATVARYPAGTPVQVHYDPADPTLSVIDAGDDWSNLIPVGVGFFCLIFSIVFIWIAIKITRRMLDSLAATAATAAPPTPS